MKINRSELRRMIKEEVYNSRSTMDEGVLEKAFLKLFGKKIGKIATDAGISRDKLNQVESELATLLAKYVDPTK